MQYYLKSSKGERGPFSVQELQQLVDRGKINGTTPVRTNGSESWVPLSELPPPPGYFDAAQSQQLSDVDFPTETPPKPFATMVPPVVVQEVASRRRRGFRASTICFAMAVIAFGFAPLWAELVHFGMHRYAKTLPGINQQKFIREEIGIRPTYWGCAIAMIASASLAAFGLVVRDFERE